jgi:small subunit ribosomal protein S14
MAKKSSVEKNEHRRELAAKFAAKRAKLKAVTKNASLPMEDRFEAQLKLAALPRNSSKTRIRNRCELTGRSRANYRKLKLSRHMLRELASSGQIPGMVKASW